MTTTYLNFIICLKFCISLSLIFCIGPNFSISPIVYLYSADALLGNKLFGSCDTYETGGSPESLDEKCGRIVPKGDEAALEQAIREEAACPGTLARIHTTPANVPTRARSPCARRTIHSTIYICPQQFYSYTRLSNSSVV